MVIIIVVVVSSMKENSSGPWHDIIVVSRLTDAYDIIFIDIQKKKTLTFYIKIDNAVWSFIDCFWCCRNKTNKWTECLLVNYLSNNKYFLLLIFFLFRRYSIFAIIDSSHLSTFIIALILIIYGSFRYVKFQFEYSLIKIFVFFRALEQDKCKDSISYKFSSESSTNEQGYLNKFFKFQ